ncbi:MAG TPA: potassium channel family protein [Solirubrobacteraceae bacterium]|nr:potassium channel family protein [Solirubrobacteraceae bacterium]
MARAHEMIRIEFPGRSTGPLRTMLLRLGVAVGLIAFVALLTYVGRDGYDDPEDESVTLLDAFYYSTVSITTTGYGDVRPVSDGARLTTTLLVTPARVLFLILLVGTTLEILAQRSRDAYRRTRWRKSLKDHVIICGFGVKGRSAVTTLVAKGIDRDSIVVIDDSIDARRRATDMGLTAIAGSAAAKMVLEQAGVREACAIVVAVDRDDTAVLATLTARELNPDATIVAAAREHENVHLLRQSGATSVITSAEASGRLLGFAVQQPRVTEVLEDLISVGEGLDIAEHVVGDDEGGPLRAIAVSGPVVAVIRGDDLMRFDDPDAAGVQAGDRVVFVRSNRR